jgi:hypothetical protein
MRSMSLEYNKKKVLHNFGGSTQKRFYVLFHTSNFQNKFFHQFTLKTTIAKIKLQSMFLVAFLIRI